jgi:hypothetical protein
MAYIQVPGFQIPPDVQPVTTVPNRCRRYKQAYPGFAPIINNLNPGNATQGAYSVVYINGVNFLPPCYGTTYVNFGSFTNIQITFYSSFNISFVVPVNAAAGTYDVTVVNIYNSNFSPAVNSSYPGNPNYSKSLTFTVSA